MPLGEFESFEDCVNKNQDKDDPEGFCAWLHHQLTGEWPSQASMRLTLAQVAAVCPSCAAKMRELGWKELKLNRQMPPHLLDALCDKFAGSFSACMDDPPPDIDDPEAFCGWLKHECGRAARGGGDGPEVRAFRISATAAEMREDDLRPKIILRPIVFNSPSDPIGSFREIIQPEAMDRTLREGIDVRALVDHDPAKILGRLSAGTMRLAKESRGLLVEVEPPNTSYARDLIVSIRRGDITGGSFTFQVLPGGETWDDSVQPPVRHVSDMRVFEVSAVTFPAYPQTGAALRSLRNWQAARKGRSLALARRQHRAALNR